MARSLELVELEEIGDTIRGKVSAIKACSALVRHSNRKIWLDPERLVSILERGAYSTRSILRDVDIVQSFRAGFRGLHI